MAKKKDRVPALGELLVAANRADWQQVVMNGGPPCFHFDSERGKFCLAAERWAGHGELHPFTNLADLIGNATYNAAALSVPPVETPAPEAVPQTRSGSFWVIEQFTDGRSQGYWNGGSSRDFTKNLDNAMQFCRKDDAQRAIWGWHWADVKVTEHLYMQAEAVPQTVHWSVQVTRNHETVVTIESNCMSGRDLQPGDDDVIRGAAQTLLGFVGQPRSDSEAVPQTVEHRKIEQKLETQWIEGFEAGYLKCAALKTQQPSRSPSQTVEQAKERYFQARNEFVGACVRNSDLSLPPYDINPALKAMDAEFDALVEAVLQTKVNDANSQFGINDAAQGAGNSGGDPQATGSGRHHRAPRAVAERSERYDSQTVAEAVPQTVEQAIAKHSAPTRRSAAQK